MTWSSCNPLTRGALAKESQGFRWGAVRTLALGFWVLLFSAGLERAGEMSPALLLPGGVRVLDLDGKRVDPFGARFEKGVVFIFTSVECPISNGYMPEYGRLADEFTPKGIVFRLVYPNGDESAEAIRKHLKDYQCSIPALRDPGHELVNVAKAESTPEAAVFVSGHGLVYHGRIDDRHVELGKTRSLATRRDLRDALVAVVHGRLPEVRATRSVGCHIAGVP